MPLFSAGDRFGGRLFPTPTCSNIFTSLSHTYNLTDLSDIYISDITDKHDITDNHHYTDCHDITDNPQATEEHNNQRYLYLCQIPQPKFWPSQSWVRASAEGSTLEELQRQGRCACPSPCVCGNEMKLQKAKLLLLDLQMY